MRLRDRIVILRKAIEAAPHGESCHGTYCAMCEFPKTVTCSLSVDSCSNFKLAPCDCWKSDPALNMEKK